MDGWILFQLAVDIALFAIVVLYVIREKKERTALKTRPGPALSQKDLKQLESLMDELAKLVMRAEKTAERIEKSAVFAREESAADSPEGGKERVDAPPEGDERYIKASGLIRKGLKDDEIGRMVGLPAHEINLIRRMGA